MEDGVWRRAIGWNGDNGTLAVRKHPRRHCIVATIDGAVSRHANALDAPIADTGDDTYFGRVLAYGPDPLLAIGLELQPAHVTDPEPPLPIDPEPVRVVFAGQDSDEAGLDAMAPLLPAVPSGGVKDGVHWLLPLPPGIAPDALELFGFWTYEFRVGHSTQWSTAQGRFGQRSPSLGDRTLPGYQPPFHSTADSRRLAASQIFSPVTSAFDWRHSATSAVSR